LLGGMMIRYSAEDKDGIRRVWGVGDSHVEAINQCQLALSEYLEKRPHYKGQKYKIKENPIKTREEIKR
tara:strand:- start:1840 stop:2046 length:207 start_codon:yes stop_codon:yes gene_type:complete